ncbi:MAG: hypothetical protein D6160_15255 [Ketobacter sp.]|nr:MAG: hypothetical protein D6160_15255 [Ketobacter sp.]
MYSEMEVDARWKNANGSIQPPLVMFIVSLMLFSMVYGFFANRYNWFPASVINNAVFAFHQISNPDSDWTITGTDKTELVTVAKADLMAPGLTKIVNVEADRSLAVKVINSGGEVLHRWKIEWQDIWPQSPDYLKEPEIPKERPGTHIHGAQILANGDLVFNFEHLSLVSLDPCGNLNWKLPYRTHHSVFIDDDENIWVSAQRDHEAPIPELPLIQPGFIEPVLLKVSPQGEILLEKSVFDLLIDNRLQGALYANSIENDFPYVKGDMFHLNDVEVFTGDKKEGFFKKGDVMISLRNINTVFVFNSDWEIKYQMSYEFVRQHDPDFFDGNTITLFDNNNVDSDAKKSHSRILGKNAISGETRVLFKGNREVPFYSNIMGKHQWLPNGNLLINEWMGRAIEVTPGGELAWEYNTIVSPGKLGLTEEAERLPQQFNEEYFKNIKEECGKP